MTSTADNLLEAWMVRAQRAAQTLTQYAKAPALFTDAAVDEVKVEFDRAQAEIDRWLRP